jgi:hypothetical protein
MRRVLVVAMLALACGGSDDAPPPPPAEFSILNGSVVCHQPDRAYHVRASGAVSLCEWDCATFDGQTGFVQVGFGYMPSGPVVVMPIVVPAEGCQ